MMEVMMERTMGRSVGMKEVKKRKGGFNNGDGGRRGEKRIAKKGLDIKEEMGYRIDE